VDPNSKSRFVCFAEKGIAMKCVDYSAEFRARNRIWPCLDMTSENKKLELAEEVNFPYGSPRIIKRSLEIETFDFNTLDKISGRSNISFYCILSFDVIFGQDTESIRMTGQEMDGVANPGDFGEWMDFSLKTK
tara:strand:- start:7141 stop:7539 length:399 start_codon:yes stop_codon:yes gene_type:complete